ncbi:hypothetical protein NY10_2203 [Carnobacterium antarcticum]|nr:hypothetical protein NY10_2203 [Carnobacterium sp. CP1]
MAPPKAFSPGFQDSSWLQAATIPPEISKLWNTIISLTNTQNVRTIFLCEDWMEER